MTKGAYMGLNVYDMDPRGHIGLNVYVEDGR